MNQDFNTKILSTTDKTYFLQAVQLYFFFKQELIEPLEFTLSKQLDEGANLVYSLIRTYVLNEKYEITYLEEINQLLREIDTHSNEILSALQIPIRQIKEIELQDLVPLQFKDAETNDVLQVLVHTREGVILWSLKNETNQ
jgi:hypothetical protein